MIIREYIEKDYQEIKRTWEETGWLAPKEDKEIFRLFVDSSEILVGEIDGTAEGSVFSIAGDIFFNGVKMPLNGVAGVTTSRVARKRGLAGKITAASLARAAMSGSWVAALGMFEQGYYNLLGFGTGCYEHDVSFDPADLLVPPSERPPIRLGAGDSSEIHNNRLNRRRGHGGINLFPEGATRTDVIYKDDGFGLGFRHPENGELTHHMWIIPRRVETGPYRVLWMAYQNFDQFLELLSLLRDLGDQVHLIRMNEPAGIQLQDLIKQPMKKNRITQKGDFPVNNLAEAYWQMRILDLKQCMQNTHFPDGQVSFNLELTDSIKKFLDPAEEWQGIGGEYCLTLGPQSEIREGFDSSLPRLKASVGAFTRMWLGVLPASGIAVTDELTGPEELLIELDHLINLPQPQPGWDF